MSYVKQSWVDNATEVDKTHMDHIEDGLVALDTGNATAKGQPNGYAGLGADGKVPAAQLPAGSSPLPPVVNGQWLKGVGGAAVWSPITTADIPSLAATYQVVSAKGTANGYASLGTDGKVPVAQLPTVGRSLPTVTYPASYTTVNDFTGTRHMSGRGPTFTPQGSGFVIAMFMASF